MAKQYTKEELWGLYNKLPQELQEAVFSQETADHIFNICERNGAKEVSPVASSVGLVLMGLLRPTELAGELQAGVKLKKKTAEDISAEINRFVLSPVKQELEKLYTMELNIQKPQEQKA
ncbi:hypothetical protein KKI17_00120, partial [Patescibacteria group bacterium]|nr:hypothetical protein [Patescibacteria group bacterium]